MDKDTTGETPTHSPAENEHSEPAAPASQPAPSKAVLLGKAMNALLQTADVQVQRGDETRVLSRANEALADVERRHAGTLADRAPSSSAPSPSDSSGPPRPRVDAMLWIVLTAGLFAIVGWMLAYGL